MSAIPTPDSSIAAIGGPAGSVASSDTADDSSLVTLTPSLRAGLYRNNETGIRMQALNEDYNWPSDSHAIRSELLVAKIMECLCEDNGLWYEPEKGKLARAVSGVDRRLLDMGSGVAASWVISMAERFEESEVVGLDLVPCELSYLPPNVSLEIWDFIKGLPFPDNYFSLIHSRGTMSKVFLDHGANSFNILMEMSRCLRPGGILILEESDKILGTTTNDPSDLYLARAQEQVNLHVERYAAGQPHQERLFDWPREMGAFIRTAEGFRPEDEGSEVVDQSFTVGLGDKEGVSDTESLVRSLARESWLLTFELSRLAAYADASEMGGEKEAAESKRLEELSIPKEDVGLYGNMRIVWAEKGVVVKKED